MNGTWREQWRTLAARLRAWKSLAELFVKHQAAFGVTAHLQAASDSLIAEAQQLHAEIKVLQLPIEVSDKVRAVDTRLYGLSKVVDGSKAVVHHLMLLSSLGAPVEEAFAESEEPRRSLVDRAFLHLTRQLAVDESVRVRWRKAFAKHEPACEKLGALHLLSHGIFAFKVDAMSGRTDLILGEPVVVTDQVASTGAMVLTEWKLVREGEGVTEKAVEGLGQAKRYARNELLGFELRYHRYVVLVSKEPLHVPTTSVEAGCAYHFVNVPIEPQRPSEEARRPPERRRNKLA